MINDSLLVVVDMLHDFIDGSLACANADADTRAAATKVNNFFIIVVLS